MKHTILTKNVKETLALGRRLGVKLRKDKIHRKTSFIIFLQGELGSGKTTFVQGLARGLGLRVKIKSPTFLLMRSWNLARGRKLWHFDFYRIKNAKDVRSLGLKGIFADSNNIVVIEWPENIKKTIIRRDLVIKFEHGSKPDLRKIILISRHKFL